MTAQVINLNAFAGNRELEEGVVRALVGDNHLPENLVEKAEVYGALHNKAALGVQVSVDPSNGKILGSCFRFLGRGNAEIITVSSPANKLWPDVNKNYKLTITVGVMSIRRLYLPCFNV